MSFAGSGLVTPSGPPVGGQLPLVVINTANVLDGAAGWTLSSAFDYDLALLTGQGTFSFSMGADAISGAVSMVTVPVAGGGGFALTYTVLGGSGAYAGVTGSGSSLVRLLGDPQRPPTPYIEAGIITSSRGPEANLLMLAGVGGVWLASRRAARREIEARADRRCV